MMADWICYCSVMSSSLRPYGQQHARLSCSSLSPGVCLDSCPLSQWCDPTISSSAALFFHLQSFPASRSFPMSQVFLVSQLFNQVAKVSGLQLQQIEYMQIILLTPTKHREKIFNLQRWSEQQGRQQWQNFKSWKAGPV